MALRKMKAVAGDRARLAGRTVTACSVVAAVLVGLPADSASALPLVKLRCGDTITQSVELRADVGPCTGDGLIVTASDITVNLGGHRIFGASEQSTSFVGMRLRNVAQVTVQGPGTISRFAAGVAIVRGGRNTIRGLNVHHNNSTQFVADNPGLAEFGDGIAIVASSRNLIARNRVHDNGPFSGISVFTFTDPETGAITGPPPERNVIRGNQVLDNNVPDVCPSSGTFFGGPCERDDAVFNEDIGIRIEGPAARFTTVANNQVSGSGRDGIVVHNTFNASSAPGIDLPPNTDTLITGNDSSGNGTAVTILDAERGQRGGDGFFNRCYVSSPPQGCATRTTVVDNVFRNNPAHGIALGMSQGNTVMSNVAKGNGFGTMTSSSSDPPYTDGFDLNVDCDHNTWRDNELGTVNQRCVRGHDGSRLASNRAAAKVVAAGGVMPARLGGRATL